MGSQLKRETWDSLTNATWTDKIHDLVQLKQVVGFQAIKLFTPFAVCKRGDSLTFREVTIYDNTKEYEPPTQFYFIQLFLNEKYRKRNFGLEVTFPAKVIISSVRKKPNYFYKWGKKYVTITMYLGTLNKDLIISHAKTLLKECQMFYWLYCDCKTPFPL